MHVHGRCKVLHQSGYRLQRLYTNGPNDIQQNHGVYVHPRLFFLHKGNNAVILIAILPRISIDLFFLKLKKTANPLIAIGQEVKNHLCPHFEYSRADLFNIVYVKKLETFAEIMKQCGKDPESLGCEVCKPTIGSITASLFNKHIMDPDQRFLQGMYIHG